MRFLAMAVATLLAGFAPVKMNAQGGMCYLNTSPQYQRMGGAGVLGPLPCDRCRATVQNEMSGGWCSDAASSGTTSTRTTPSTAGSVAADGVQTAINNFWDGWRRGREQARQRAMMEQQRAMAEENARQARVAAARERVRQRQIELAAAREDERRQRQAAFDRAREDLGRELRLAPRAQVTPGLRRTGATPGELPSGLRRSTSVVEEPRGLQRLVCSASIANDAATAALRGDYAEARFLGEQSTRAQSGGRLDVQCPSSSAVPEIGALRCTVRQADGPVVEVPCDDDGLVGFFPELLESTVEEINRLAHVRERFPDPPRARAEAAAKVRERTAALERARAEGRRATPSPAPAPRSQQCTTDLCEQARRALAEAREREAEVEEAMDVERDARAALQRNATILREVRSNPAGVNNMVRRAARPRGRR